MRLKYIYRVVGLPKEELNGREVALVAKLTEPNPNLIFLRAEPLNN
jgi:hypothetical protein